jgi:hypothetical protein
MNSCRHGLRYPQRLVPAPPCVPRHDTKDAGLSIKQPAHGLHGQAPRCRKFGWREVALHGCRERGCFFIENGDARSDIRIPVQELLGTAGASDGLAVR